MKIPLFPLGTVLFPEGVLPLRIFEPRYLTMVGDCMRNGTGFGVVLISEGSEVEGAVKFHKTGTIAKIHDFDQLDDGHLGLSCRGNLRFNVVRHDVQDDQLIIAEVIPLIEESDLELGSEYDAMYKFVHDLYRKEELKAWAESIQPQWRNGEWLGCRLCEILPLSMESRQTLLEMNSAERLDYLSRVMIENKMI